MPATCCKELGQGQPNTRKVVGLQSGKKNKQTKAKDNKNPDLALFLKETIENKIAKVL